MVFLLAQAARGPPQEPRIHHLEAQIVLLRLSEQYLHLLRQARHVREARRPTTRTPAHKTLLRLPMQGLRADVARLAFGVLGARLRRYHYGLRVLLIRIVLLSAAGLFYFLAEPVMAALFPVFFLAFGPAVACAAAAAFLAQGKPKLGGADGALREDHLLYGQVARGQPYYAKINA